MTTEITPCLKAEPLVPNTNPNLKDYPATVGGLLDADTMVMYGAPLHLLVVSPRYLLQSVAMIAPVDTAKDLLDILVDHIQPDQWPRLLEQPGFPVGSGESFTTALIDLREKMRDVPYSHAWASCLQQACLELVRHCDDKDQTLEIAKIFKV